jgi:hypothetical protein
MERTVLEGPRPEKKPNMKGSKKEKKPNTCKED